MKCLSALAFALSVLGLSASLADAAAWVQMTAAGAEVRLVTTAPRCPSFSVEGRAFATTQRAAPTEGFPNRVCSAPLPRGARRISVEGQTLPAPKARPLRIVVIGDTGCRLKGLSVQHCNDPSGWPFARVARLAAAARPDLVIHVGDYYYREESCPWGDTACAGSPYGDRWATWKAEVFDPAAPLLAAAPWVFARGNHEDCKRGGDGWFRLLDAAPRVKRCPAQSDSFAVELGGLRLFVVDSADTDDLIPRASLVKAFAKRLRGAGAGGEPTWIVTHRPVWNVLRLGDLLGDGLLNATERAAVKRSDLAGVDLIVSGHVHNFASLSFGRVRPAQLIVGTGGDTLEVDAAPPPATATTEVDRLPAAAFAMGRFGYFVFDRDGQGADWRGAFHDLTDRIVATCLLRGRALTCRAV
jgi:predicted phosphodiesterase